MVRLRSAAEVLRPAARRGPQHWDVAARNNRAGRLIIEQRRLTCADSLQERVVGHEQPGRQLERAQRKTHREAEREQGSARSARPRRDPIGGCENAASKCKIPKTEWDPGGQQAEERSGQENSRAQITRRLQLPCVTSQQYSAQQ